MKEEKANTLAINKENISYNEPGVSVSFKTSLKLKNRSTSILIEGQSLKSRRRR
jgi:hypothetical protein